MTPHTPPTNPNRPEGALERREAPPPSPTSCFIVRTRCHRPQLRHAHIAAAVTEPEPLRQAAAAPATATDDMVSDAAPLPAADGLHPLLPLSSFLVVVVDLDLDVIHCLSVCLKFTRLDLLLGSCSRYNNGISRLTS